MKNGKKRSVRPRARTAPDVNMVKHAGGHPQCIGYARVSKLSQPLQAQMARLKEAGCCRVYWEQLSGAAQRRPSFAAMIDHLQKGDTVVVVQLDRIGHRSSELVGTLDGLRELGVHFRDLESGVDTRGPHGRALLAFLATLATARRTLHSESIREALGEVDPDELGRPRVITPERVALASKMAAEHFSTRKIATSMHVSATTVRRMLALRAREDPKQVRLFE